MSRAAPVVTPCILATVFSRKTPRFLLPVPKPRLRLLAPPPRRWKRSAQKPPAVLSLAALTCPPFLEQTTLSKIRRKHAPSRSEWAIPFCSKRLLVGAEKECASFRTAKNFILH